MRSFFFLNQVFPSPGYLFFLWMALVFISCVYNYLFVPLRGSFGTYLHAIPGVYAWLTFDYVMDLVYFLDMVAIQPHLSFGCNGVQEVCRRRFIAPFTHVSFTVVCVWFLLSDQPKGAGFEVHQTLVICGEHDLPSLDSHMFFHTWTYTHAHIHMQTHGTHTVHMYTHNTHTYRHADTSIYTHTHALMFFHVSF